MEQESDDQQQQKIHSIGSNADLEYNAMHSTREIPTFAIDVNQTVLLPILEQKPLSRTDNTGNKSGIYPRSKNWINPQRSSQGNTHPRNMALQCSASHPKARKHPFGNLIPKAVAIPEDYALQSTMRMFLRDWRVMEIVACGSTRKALGVEEGQRTREDHLTPRCV